MDEQKKAPHSPTTELDTLVQQWAKFAEPQRVELSDHTGATQTGTVYIQHWDKKQRLIRSFKALGLCWGGAILSLPIPPVHWVSVPVLFIAGPSVAVFTYLREGMILGGLAQCPHCNAAFKIVRNPIHWPLRDVCSSCLEHVTIQPV